MPRRETYRQIGAIGGLLLGWAVMWLTWTPGLVPAAITGIVGCVAGAVTAEKFWDSKFAQRGLDNESWSSKNDRS